VPTHRVHQWPRHGPLGLGPCPWLLAAMHWPPCAEPSPPPVHATPPPHAEPSSPHSGGEAASSALVGEGIGAQAVEWNCGASVGEGKGCEGLASAFSFISEN
jgi:hypothetical protein